MEGIHAAGETEDPERDLDDRSEASFGRLLSPRSQAIRSPPPISHTSDLQDGYVHVGHHAEDDAESFDSNEQEQSQLGELEHHTVSQPVQCVSDYMLNAFRQSTSQGLTTFRVRTIFPRLQCHRSETRALCPLMTLHLIECLTDLQGMRTTGPYVGN